MRDPRAARSAAPAPAGVRRRGVASAPTPQIDVVEAKLRPPLARPGVVKRLALVKRLRREPARVVSFVAPAGYGKTTLLSQWADAERRPVVWVSLDARDNDPFTLLKHAVVAIDRVAPLDPRILASLAAPRTPPLQTLVGRAARALASIREPIFLVLDNADLVHTQPARDLVTILTLRLPDGSTAALAGRSPPRIAAGGVREIGVKDLALHNWEAQLLLRRDADGLSERDSAALIELCEGWAAPLYLASLSLRHRADDSVPSDVAGHRYLAEYLRVECLSRLRPHDLAFLRRASILDELTPSLCDAVLQTDRSARTLDRLAHAHLGVVPIEGKPGRFRFHRLLRSVLQRDLLEDEPQLVHALRRRAAEWYSRRGDVNRAVEHAAAAGDADAVAALIVAGAMPELSRGRADDVERWIELFDDERELEAHPAVALHGSWLYALRGRSAKAERWLTVAERGARRRRADAVALRPRVAVVRAALCRDGASRMLADARTAVADLPTESQWYPAALHVRANAALLLGAVEAESLLANAARAADAIGAAEIEMVALAQLSLVAQERGDIARADELSTEAHDVATGAELTANPTFAIVLAAGARAALRHRDSAKARAALAAAEPLRPSLRESLPWLAVGARLELLRCYVALGDVEAARAVVAEAVAIVATRRGLGVLADRVHDALREVATMSTREPAVPAGLTPAELRLLPLLATHLSFREIADQLDVSRNTIKTQAISIYRKLGVSGRSEAIAAAAELEPA